jgi:hypothetical protein
MGRIIEEDKVKNTGRGDAETRRQGEKRTTNVAALFFSPRPRVSASPRRLCFLSRAWSILPLLQNMIKQARFES